MTYKALKDLYYYNLFRKRTSLIFKGDLCGTNLASNIIIPVNESSIEEDYDNAQLSSSEYIDLLITKGYIKEVV